MDTTINSLIYRPMISYGRSRPLMVITLSKKLRDNIFGIVFELLESQLMLTLVKPV